jgi:hypothetical protein
MSNHVRPARQRQRGFILTLYPLMMLFIIMPIVGLAIDAGILYMIKGKLQVAVDGAALGAARSLNQSTVLANQEPLAGATAIRYYHANFPNNWMGVTPVNDPTVSWANSTTSTAVVDITGTVIAPTWFMRILGFNSVTLAATGEAVRRNVNVMLVLDRSYSLFSEMNCGTLQTDAQAFVNSFVEGRDRLGMVTFGTSYNYDFAFNTTFQSALTTKLSNLSCTGYTNAAAGFTTGFTQLKNLNDQFSLNVIVFFTDGQPNTMTFGVGGTSPLPISASSSCNPHSNITGVIAGDASAYYNSWGGVLQWTNAGIPLGGNTDFNQAPNTNGCSFSGNYQGTGNNAAFANDISSLPSTDAFGNSTNSTWAGGTNGSFPYSVTLTGNWYYLQNLENAGINTLDNAAQNARVAAAAAGVPYVVYTIGLDPSVYGSVNQELLRRIANDKLSAVYQSTYTAGKFYYVPSAGQLSQAFADVSSDILRLAR